MHKFKVTLTADFFDDSGKSKFADLGLSIFEASDAIEVAKFDKHLPEISSEQLIGCQGVIVLTPRVSQSTLSDAGDLLAVGRFGVGYDSVDVDACSAQDVLAMITSGAVDRPVAEATVGWMLALTHHMLAKDQLVRTGRWNDRTNYMGVELRDRTLGIIGLGGIGRSLVSLLQTFGMRQPIAFDPFVPSEVLEELGVRSVGLDELMSSADFVSVHCPLNEHTRGLIGKQQISQIKREAYLINTARGGIIDEDALFAALKGGKIAGAALDCFEGEPIIEPHRFGELDNVILAPHAIAWTAEMFRDIGRTACQSMLDLAVGRRPRGVLNPGLFNKASFRGKWSRLTGIPLENLP